MESEVDEGKDNEEHTSAEDLLPKTVELLDYFDAALDVVVGCARKTEMTRWKHLFSIVGNPNMLFEASEMFSIANFILNFMLEMC